MADQDPRRDETADEVASDVADDNADDTTSREAYEREMAEQGRSDEAADVGDQMG